jgi:DNA-binding response OmpR family regulator
MAKFIYTYSSTLLPPSLKKEVDSLSPTNLKSIYETPSTHKCFLILYIKSAQNPYHEEIKHIKKLNPKVTVILLIDSPDRQLFKKYLSQKVDYPIHIYNKYQNFLTYFKYILSENKNQFPTLSNQHISIDANNKSVTLNQQPLQLRKKEYQLLSYLLIRAGQIVTKTELLENVWEYRYDVFTKTIDTHIHHLKKKINKHHPILETVYGQGYRLLNSTS